MADRDGEVIPQKGEKDVTALVEFFGTPVPLTPASAAGLRLESIGLNRMRAMGLLGALGWFAGLVMWHRNVVMDDPWITFRYARNLLEGHGLVFNTGEWVEGYSNFTWVLLSAIPIQLGIEPLGAMRALSLVCAVVIFAMLAFRMPERADGAGGGYMGIFLLAAAYPFAVWTMGGLETIFYTLLLLFVVREAAHTDSAEGGWKHGIAMGALLSILAMTRPEGAMFAALPAGLALLRARRGERVAAARLAIGLGLFVAAFGAYIYARYSMYGEWLPNSVTAKIGASLTDRFHAGLGYLSGYFFGAPSVLAIAAIWGTMRVWKEEFDPTLVLCAAACVLQIAFTFGVGGDWMPGYRFVVPVLPLMCLLAGHGLAKLPLFVRGIAVWFVLVASPIGSGFDGGGGPGIGLRLARWMCEKRLLVAPLEEIGRDLGAVCSPDDTIAMTEAGVVPYYSRMRLIDMLGLMDKEIAAMPGGLHEKTGAESVLARQPRYILLGVTVLDGREVETWKPDAEISALPEFRASYHPVKRWRRAMTDGKTKQEGFMILFERMDAEDSVFREAPTSP